MGGEMKAIARDGSGSDQRRPIGYKRLGATLSRYFQTLPLRRSYAAYSALQAFLLQVEVGALPGMNGALAFGVSNTGYVVGSSMLNQGPGLPFIWSNQGGIVAIPLAASTSEGSARAVNSDGWVVGNDSSAFSIPFLYDGTNTHRLADLIPPNSGWDLSMNTSSSADGISESGVIVGTGVHNGETHAYAMVPAAPTPTPTPSPTPTPTATARPSATPTPAPRVTPTPRPRRTARPRPGL